MPKPMSREILEQFESYFEDMKRCGITQACITPETALAFVDEIKRLGTRIKQLEQKEK